MGAGADRAGKGVVSPVLAGCALVAALVLAAALLAVWRGPTVFDRFVGVSLAAAVTLVLLVLLGFLSGRPELYLDAALTYALLAAVVPIAMSRYVDRSGRTRPDGAADPADEGEAP